MYKSISIVVLSVLAFATLMEAKLLEDEVSCLAHTAEELETVANLYPNVEILKNELERSAESGSQTIPTGLAPETVNDCYKLTLMYNSILRYTLCDGAEDMSVISALDVNQKLWAESDNEQEKVQHASPELYENLLKASYCDHYIQSKLEQIANA